VRPTWRVLGALLLWASLEWYGATSEVSWLFLLASWVFALLVISAGYALWNRRGLILSLTPHGSRPAEGSPASELPDGVLRTGPHPSPLFEGDALELEIGLSNTGAARGPAWVAGDVAGTPLRAATGLIPRGGWRSSRSLEGLRRGPIGASGWTVVTSDPLGFFQSRAHAGDAEVALVLPRFTSLAGRVRAREMESSVPSPRAGAGNELFGVREYHAGDSLRRIHWRSSARRGELVVREYEPPGVQSLAVYMDPSPRTPGVADQLARIAASEAWDCIREGGRVALWAPGLAAGQARDLWESLEWLARYPSDVGDDPPPEGTEAVIVTGTADERLVDALEAARRRGSRVRAWVVGDADLDVDAPVEHVGIEWPL
jgi:uncharacterized protein (DUF58 family)